MAGETFYITTPIFYPNGDPHIGHAYTAVAADAIARFHRIDGRDVFFLTGTDEHGLKMQQTAALEGLSPLALADRNSGRFREMMAALEIRYDDFIRTTEERHTLACQQIWRRMEAAGDIYLDTYAGWYSVRQEAFFDEAEIILGPDGIRRESLGSPVEWVEEESYFFRLSAYGERLLALYEARPDFVQPRERRNEVASFVRSGLKDLSVSRTTFDWGVPVPGNPKHVMYVWVDALTNYLTGVGFPDEAAPLWPHWPASVHIVGKDIIRFHAVYWPAFLMSAGLPVPQRVFAHGFLMNRGEKMSKSVGNVIAPAALADRYGVDPLRYFLMREVPFGQDGSYSHETIVQRINADLANDLGNLAQRTLTMIARNCDARVPERGPGREEDEVLLAQARALVPAVREAMNAFQLHTALAEIWAVVAEANRYIAAAEPWTLRKTDPARMAEVLHVTAEAVRIVAILVQPFMPGAAARLLDLLGIGEGARGIADIAASPLEPGSPLPAPLPIFPRYVDSAA